MTITCIYRTEVQVPEAIFQAFGHLPEFDRDVLAATQGLVSGQDAYGRVYIWAEGPMLSQIQRVDAALHAMLALYNLRLEASRET